MIFILIFVIVIRYNLNIFLKVNQIVTMKVLT